MTLLLFLSAVVAGALGSAHCVGMCGPFVLVLEADGDNGERWRRRIAYNAGRLSFYAGLGALAGAGGTLLTQLPMGGVLLRCIAALLIVAMGLQLLSHWQPLRQLERLGGRLWQRIAPLTRALLPANTLPRAYLAGCLWGALPCGLVYSALALATASGSAAGGIAIMAGFWSGTLPALLLTGRAAAGIGKWRQQPRTRRLAGMAMLLGGIIALYLPLAHLDVDHADPASAQPGMHQHGGH